ncbi:MAG: hypothetical protein WBB17_10720, partial [Saprospiraceae bacterium]
TIYARHFFTPANPPLGILLNYSSVDLVHGLLFPEKKFVAVGAPVSPTLARREAGRIWSGESPGMERVNHPPLPSVAPLAEQ